ncbi:pro-sigmaK processing inhibitor BofA family protein [Anaerotignum sp.]|nr:pro-sigmaK processing inhibitor BofA family protein [Anaerotignum sp.]MBP3307265.1 pro-sigmaK processing inhibitor BofA family protein [Anaerotignum sp.]MBP3628924.1 pro-sigmaK processing inhibitor BofA family protein [Anaerotignum sp.]
MGDYVMTCAIFVCLFALALIALSKPLQMFLRFLFSAVVGGIVLFLGQSLGVSVGLNLATVLVAGLLGLPGVAGMFALSFLM